MPDLSIYLFGTPRVMIDGTERYISRRKANAILAYLALTQLPHNRDALATLFWPDYDQSGARDNLRRTLSALNSALDRKWLDADRTTVRLRIGPNLSVDTNRFQSLVANCGGHGHAEDQLCERCLP